MSTLFFLNIPYILSSFRVELVSYSSLYPTYPCPLKNQTREARPLPMTGPEHPWSRCGGSQCGCDRGAVRREGLWGGPAEEQLKARSRRPHNVSVSGVLCSCTALNRQARPAPPLCFLTASHCLSPCGLSEPPPWLPSSSSSGRDPWLSETPSLATQMWLCLADSAFLSDYTLLSSLRSRVSWGEPVLFQDGPFQVSWNAPPLSTTPYCPAPGLFPEGSSRHQKLTNLKLTSSPLFLNLLLHPCGIIFHLTLATALLPEPFLCIHYWPSFISISEMPEVSLKSVSNVLFLSRLP